MNKDRIKGNMKELLGKAKQKWAMLGDDDLQLYAEGKTQEFSGKIQKAYGRTKDEAEKEISKFEADCGCGSSSDRAA